MQQFLFKIGMAGLLNLYICKRIYMGGSVIWLETAWL